MKQQGKFTLLDRNEFLVWLNKFKCIRAIKVIQEHHTYIPNYSHFKGSNHFAMLEGMDNSHKGRGFDEIAQNFTIFPDGTIALCRSINKVPAGIKGVNGNGICIEIVGNFDKDGDIMSKEQAETVTFVTAVLCKKFKLIPSTNTVVYHHWFDLNKGFRTNGSGTTKSCPGTRFFGGNTVEAANKNFIPLVKKVYESLK